MKYHYQQGVTEKDKKGHKKLWLGFFGTVALIGYGGFIFASLALNGYPLVPIDHTANLVKTSKPGSLGNHLFIPAINLSAPFNDSLSQSGKAQGDHVTVKGAELALGFTPRGLRSVSPFFNLDKLKNGDEVFLDNGSTRFVYRITASPNRDNDKKLTLKGKGKELTAQAIGVIAWNGGKTELRPL